MNRGKEGGRYLYHNTLIELQASIRAYLHLSYRQQEGLTQALLSWELRLRTPD